LGALAGNLVPIATGVGICAGALIAPYLNLEEWNPQLHHHSYVGTYSPDDDMS